MLQQINQSSRVAVLAQISGAGAHPVLRLGSKGAAVVELQKKLAAKGFSPGAADGDFGPKTLAAVKAFQKANGLVADGIVGPKTWAKLGVTNPSGHLPGAKLVKGYNHGTAYNLWVAPIGGGKYLSEKAAPKFKAMMAAASKAGIHLSINSAFRTYAEQAALYRKYGSPRAARPGYSNHQQGLSVDIGGIGGYGTRAYKWLAANAAKYGFKNDVKNEFWHWTFKG
jgi:hypothetical protein